METVVSCPQAAGEGGGLTFVSQTVDRSATHPNPTQNDSPQTGVARPALVQICTRPMAFASIVPSLEAAAAAQKILLLRPTSPNPC